MKPFFLPRVVDDPSYTDGLYYGDETARRAARSRITVTENAMERIGALCFIRHRSAHHEKAAEWFKAAYEAKYGSAMPAVDASRVQVDTSPVAHDGGAAARIDNGRDLAAVMSAIGPASADRVIACVVLCSPAGDGLHWRPRSEAVRELLGDLDAIAKFMGWA